MHSKALSSGHGVRPLNVQPPGIADGATAGEGAADGVATGVWVGVGAQAGHFGETDTAVHVTLPPVVVSGRRLPPESMTAALGAGPAAIECVKDAFPNDGASRNRVNLSQ